MRAFEATEVSLGQGESAARGTCMVLGSLQRKVMLLQGECAAEGTVMVWS